MIVYELSWWYYDEKTYDGEEMIIAVYSSRKQAETALERFKKHPRFKGHEEDFYISEYKLNERWWAEGYVVNAEHEMEEEEENVCV